MRKIIFKNKLAILFVVSIILVIIFFFLDRNRADIIIIVNKPTQIFIHPEEPTSLFFFERELKADNKVISILEKGEVCIVTHTKYSKNNRYFKIRTKDGRIGYLSSDPDKIRTIIIPK